MPHLEDERVDTQAALEAIENRQEQLERLEENRRVLLEGAPPDWRGLLYFTLFAIVVFLCGYWWFARTRRSFADVI